VLHSNALKPRAALLSRAPTGTSSCARAENATFAVEVWDEDAAGLSYQWSVDGAYYPALTGPDFTYLTGFRGRARATPWQ